MIASRTTPPRFKPRKHKKIFAGFGCLVLFAGFTGCATAPAPESPDLDFRVPETWSAAGTENQGDVGRGWIDDFGDPLLKILVAEALDQNFDLRITAARLEAARADAVIQRANQWPQADAGGRARKSQDIMETPSGPLRSRGERYSLSADVSWELDLWGKLRDRAAAGQAGAEAAMKDLESARLLLAGKLSKAWFAAVEGRLQVELAHKTVESYRHSAEKIQSRYREGIASALDLRLALTDLAGAKALLQERKDEYQKTLRGLQVLLGRYPDADVAVARELPRLNRFVPAGLPSKLLFRRPDIRASEQRLAAAERRLRAANKDLLPSFTLTASAGTVSETLRNVVDANYGVWDLAGGLLQPLFQGGRLRALVKRADAGAREALLDYGKIALTAFREVEEALSAEALLLEREIALGEAVIQAEAAERLAWEEYAAGVADIITVLSAQRRVLESRSARIAVRNQRLRNRVNLHLALGGDFFESAGENDSTGLTSARSVLETGSYRDQKP